MNRMFVKVLVVIAMTPLVLPVKAGAQASRVVMELCERDEQCRERHKQQMLEKMVDEAQQLIEEKGEVAFEEFRVPGSVWNNGKGADLFVLEEIGTITVHPSPEFAGKEGLKMSEVNGKPYYDDTVSRKDAAEKGWTSALWQKIKSFKLLRDHHAGTAVAPNGQTYVVVSTLVISEMQREFVEQLVHDAAALIREKGRKAFPAFYEKDSKFRYKDTYVFVLDSGGRILVEPACPSVEGQGLDSMDPTVRHLLEGPITLMKRLEEKEDAGWEIYRWYKPGSEEPCRKASYGMKVTAPDGQNYIVGTGVYLND